MSELRKDYFTDKLVIVNTKKHKSIDFRLKNESPKESKCPYCPGNELMTPPARLVLVQKEKSLLKLTDAEEDRVEDWCVRAFLDEFPVVTPRSDVTYSEDPLYCEPAYGYHYIIVATPKHDENFQKMGVEQWVNVLSVVQDRVRWLYSRKNVSYVSIFANYGEEAGATIEHPHLQIITLPRLPPIIEQEASKVRITMREKGVCPMCEVLNIESGGPRQILTTNHFIAFAPWAPSHTFEYWIFPKKHQTSILKVTQKEIRDLVLILRSTLSGLSSVLSDPPYSIVFHISSEKKTTRQLHWHLKIFPQIRKWTGFEKGTHTYINQVSPEETATLLGSASRKELAKIIGIS